MTSWAEGYQILEAVILHLLLQHNVRDLHRYLPTCGDSTPVPGFNQDGRLTVAGLCSRPSDTPSPDRSAGHSIGELRMGFQKGCAIIRQWPFNFPKLKPGLGLIQ